MPAAVSRGWCAKEYFNFRAAIPENLVLHQVDGMSLSIVQDTDPDCVIAFDGPLRKLIP